MAHPLLMILTGRNLPKIRQPQEPAPSIINEKTIADFTRVVEEMGILRQLPLLVRMTPALVHEASGASAGKAVRLAISAENKSCGWPAATLDAFAERIQAAVDYFRGGRDET